MYSLDWWKKILGKIEEGGNMFILYSAAEEHTEKTHISGVC